MERGEGERGPSGRERRGAAELPWLDPERVARAKRAARRIVRESLRGERGDSLAEAIRSLYADVPRVEWLARAAARLLLRTVERASASVWRVYGVPELGDWYNVYIVSIGADGKYRCSCFNTRFGYVRRARICTHIAAVMLKRRQRKIEDYFRGDWSP
ncbi:MAG: hypothetical protein LM580_00125 [Thermofilum sp.]|nr:hypothetical protein [Thermofilum sp.]